jgi:hypothetical protein
VFLKTETTTNSATIIVNPAKLILILILVCQVTSRNNPLIMKTIATDEMFAILRDFKLTSFFLAMDFP